jgi:hypothetical protein
MLNEAIERNMASGSSPLTPDAAREQRRCADGSTTSKFPGPKDFQVGGIGTTAGADARRI